MKTHIAKTKALPGAALLLAFSLMLTPLALPSKALAGGRPEGFADLAKEVSASVVNIRIEKTMGGQEEEMGTPRQMPRPKFRGPGGQEMPDMEEFFRRFFGGRGMPQHPFKQRALGSGVIVDSDGFVLTNNHVVEGADKITVKLKSGKEIDATIVGRDSQTDLALIKLKENGDYPALELGDSDKLRVGDWVLAVGNPFGLEDTVTAGIVSAKGRIIGAGPYDDFIQTDASINPGNSGGALVDMDGRLVGIPSAIVAQGQGIGFAIPINMAKTIMTQLKDKGRVDRGWLGVYIQPVTKDLAEKFGLKADKGVLVSDVMKDGPAKEAGFQRGDVIVKFDGKEITDSQELLRLVAAAKIGDKIDVEVVRGGDHKTLTVKIAQRPNDESGEAADESPASLSETGLTLQPLTPELAKELGTSADKGLVVSSVAPGSPAAERGVQRGDLILEAASRPVGSVSQLEEAWKQVPPGKGLLLLMERENHTFFAVLPKAAK